MSQRQAQRQGNHAACAIGHTSWQTPPLALVVVVLLLPRRVRIMTSRTFTFTSVLELTEPFMSCK